MNMQIVFYQLQIKRVASLIDIITEVKVIRETGNIFQPVIDNGRLALSTKTRRLLLKRRDRAVQSQA